MTQLGLDLEGSGKKEPRIAVFDIETQKGADEVGGWGNVHLMKVAIAVVHDSADDQYKVFEEKDVPEMLTLLKACDLVVGFNSRRFDYTVLRGYTEEDLAATLPTLDILEHVQKALGFRVGLNNIAAATVGAEKSADGLQSLKWFKEGKLDLITDYCIQDVRVTRDVYLYGLQNRKLFFTDRRGIKQEIAVSLPQPAIR